MNFQAVNITFKPTPQRLRNSKKNIAVPKDSPKPNKSSGSVPADGNRNKTTGDRPYSAGPSAVPPSKHQSSSNPKSKPKRNSSENVTKATGPPRNPQQNRMKVPQKAPITKPVSFKRNIEDLNKLMAARAALKTKPKRPLAKFSDKDTRNQAYSMPSVILPPIESSTNSIKRNSKEASSNLISFLATNRNFILNKIILDATDQSKNHPLNKNQVIMNRRANEYIESLMKKTKNIKMMDNLNHSNYESIYQEPNQLPFPVPLDNLRPNIRY